MSQKMSAFREACLRGAQNLPPPVDKKPSGISRRLSLFLQMVIGLTFSIPYLFFKDVDDQYKEVIGRGAILLVMFGFCMGVRAMAMLNTHPSDWGPSGTDNIARLRQYRESKMMGLSGNDRADLMRDTQLLDAPATDEFGPDSATARTRQYLNGKLAGMTPEAGLKYLRGDRK